MNKWTKYLAMGALACCTAAYAVPITIVNGSFDSPTPKTVDGYGAVDGWSDSGATYAGSGVEEAPGAERAYLMGSDDGAYQILAYPMVAGEVYSLGWECHGSWLDSTQTVTLVSAIATNDAFGATTTLTNFVGEAPAGGYTPATLVYTATASDAGKYIGIAFDNTGGAGSFANWDNFTMDEVSTPFPPVWTTNVIQGTDGMVSNAYSDTLSGLATDPNGDPITYSLVGPSTWLNVAANGDLTGTPGVAHSGTNTFTVAATDGIAGTNNATLNIYVAPQSILPDIVLIDNTTANGSFELSSTNAKVFFVDGDIPDWANWSEVESANNDTGTDGTGQTQNGLDGVRVAFIQPGGAIVNMVTNAPHTIAEGDEISYSVWNSNPGRTGHVEISLVYDDAGTRTQIAGTLVTVAPGTQGGGTFTVMAGDAWIGKTLGVGIADEGTIGVWPEIDQVLLGVTPKPADPVTDLVITGPIPGGTQMVLSWTGQDGASYGVETNSNLIVANWQSLISGIPGIDGTVSHTNTIGAEGELFFRIITE